MLRRSAHEASIGLQFTFVYNWIITHLVLPVCPLICSLLNRHKSAPAAVLDLVLKPCPHVTSYFSPTLVNYYFHIFWLTSSITTNKHFKLISWLIFSSLLLFCSVYFLFVWGVFFFHWTNIVHELLSSPQVRLDDPGPPGCAGLIMPSGTSHSFLSRLQFHSVWFCVMALSCESRFFLRPGHLGCSLSWLTGRGCPEVEAHQQLCRGWSVWQGSGPVSHDSFVWRDLRVLTASFLGGYQGLLITCVKS